MTLFLQALLLMLKKIPPILQFLLKYRTVYTVILYRYKYVPYDFIVSSATTKTIAASVQYYRYYYHKNVVEGGDLIQNSFDYSVDLYCTIISFNHREYILHQPFWLRSRTLLQIGSAVHPDPAGSEIICKLGSGSVINSGSDSGSKLSSVYI
jgi:hypothetical protein